MKSHPDEVNDCTVNGSFIASALWYAMKSRDEALVRSLLEHGAIPYPPATQDGQDYLLHCGHEGISNIIRIARAEYNPLETFLQARARGVKLEQRRPIRPCPAEKAEAAALP